MSNYNPVVQAFFKSIDPPEKTRGVRYAIAQGPSVVVHSTNESEVSQVIYKNLDMLLTACEKASIYKAQLITFPELFLSGYEFRKSSTDQGVEYAHASADFINSSDVLDKISEVAKKFNLAIVCPMPYSGKDPAGNTGYYDVACVFDQDGTLLGRQFKNNLWGIDERSWFHVPYYPELSSENNFQNPTNPFRVFPINEFPVGVGICYDAEFPENARNLALNGSLLTVFPTAAPDSILEGQTQPYPDISEHYIPANALTNQNFCSYSNRASWELDIEGKKILKYSGNSIISNPYGQPLVKAIANEDVLLIADCIICDFPSTQPIDTDYLINRRPELYGVLTNKTVPFPYTKDYVYPDNPPQGQDPKRPEKGPNACN